MRNNRFIISLGGSTIVPDEIDTKFLKEFKNLIEGEVKKGKKFLLITGGGRTARRYIEAAKRLGDLDPEDLDWLGIHSTRLNGHLLRTIFRKKAHQRILTNASEPEIWKEPILIGAGGQPGHSTDYQAVMFAKKYGANVILNLSNVDYVYDKNPKTHKDAKPFKDISWKEFRKLVGGKWDPGINAPFDPVASEIAEKHKYTVIVMSGRSMANLKNFLSGKPFKGTVIH
ncbi:MAG: UMP kinase [Candidatus Doudnabacteria bacterium]|nr:UMP kinase [Candidatus Doudnabacteria bacterium]